MLKDPIKTNLRHDYEVVETYEAGIALKGTEVKSLRMGKANLKDSYARIKNGEVYLIGTHISPYPFANYNNHAPLRDRKLLLKKQEIRKLVGKTKEKGLTLIPLKLYFKSIKVPSGWLLFGEKNKPDKHVDAHAKDSRTRVRFPPPPPPFVYILYFIV